MLEELPNAPRDELKQALAWRIRDRIDTPLDEAIIELLDMPAQARGGQKPSGLCGSDKSGGSRVTRGPGEAGRAQS
ncbi:MAG: hypothetical protein U5K38_02170 [Woeseiaceae bacterium]|nr:hypothetical protein [Woeseiaceae bacterium]